MKNIVRRVAVGIVIFAFFLPWLEIFFIHVSGFNLISSGFGVGTDFNIPGQITKHFYSECCYNMI